MDSASFIKSQSFPAALNSLDAINKLVYEACQAADLDNNTIYKVTLSVSEACTNIIEHAYGESSEETIDCTCWVSADEINILLHDHGKPFDPLTVPKPDIHAELEERSKGGLGLYFINELMDEVRFKSTPNEGNYLLLVKHKDDNR